MSKCIYNKIRKLCSDVVSRKETLRIVSDSLGNFDQHFRRVGQAIAINLSRTFFKIVFVSISIQSVILSLTER